MTLTVFHEFLLPLVCYSPMGLWFFSAIIYLWNIMLLCNCTVAVSFCLLYCGTCLIYSGAVRIRCMRLPCHLRRPTTCRCGTSIWLTSSFSLKASMFVSF